MPSSPREAYLDAQIKTATPQKLHLMLIEGAIRFGQLAKQHRQRNEEQEAGQAFLRFLSILGELLACARESKDELAGNITSLYAFLFRTATEAHLHQNEQKLDDVLSILEVERQTWVQVCEKFGSEETGNPTEKTEFGAATPEPKMNVQGASGVPSPLALDDSSTVEQGFSLDA